jgi:HlyD family secretion protein
MTGVAGGRAQVWRVRDGKASRVDVRLGLRGLALSEITEGLDAGDAVLADATATLDDGARVRVTPRPPPASGRPENMSGETPVNFD